MKVLVTGFDSFKGVRVNPSEQVVRALNQRKRRISDAQLITEILPTEYAAATRLLRGLIRKHRPDAVLCLGVATRRETISLERVALNLDDEITPDNAGVVRRDSKILRYGPDVYWSTLPLNALQKALQQRGIKVVVSNHAGAFLCNHAFYVARHETAQLKNSVPCGFIHLPGRSRRSKRAPSLARLTRAMEGCLSVLVRKH